MHLTNDNGYVYIANADEGMQDDGGSLTSPYYATYDELVRVAPKYAQRVPNEFRTSRFTTAMGDLIAVDTSGNQIWV